MNPYEILKIDPSADDAAVRDSYLKLVRQFPPEQHPRNFAEINRAYGMIKDETRRMKHALFPPPVLERSPMGAALAHYRCTDLRPPVGIETLKSYLQKCAMGS